MATAKKTAPAKAAAPKPAAGKATTARATPKAAAKAPAKPMAKAPAAKPAPVAKPAKADKPKKPKLVRDSFTIPKAEYTVLDDLKQRAARLGAPAKKSEVLRAGIKALAQMSDAAFQSAMAAVPAIKTGRPGKAD
ncbi:MAG: hypothetical protein AB7P37_02660 [Ramlibacter sp.]